MKNMRIIMWILIGAVTVTAAYYFAAGPNLNMALTVLAFLGGGAAGLLGYQTFQPAEKSAVKDAHMLLRQEQLDIIKKRIPSNDVRIFKEIITEEKTVTVPLVREELVVQSTPAGESGQKPETIRIPVREERLKISKEPVHINDVSVLKNNIRETRLINATLKKEVADVEVSGDVKVTTTDEDHKK
jgi:uncharacterized protein (TIGR02271 family)